MTACTVIGVNVLLVTDCTTLVSAAECTDMEFLVLLLTPIAFGCFLIASGVNSVDIPLNELC